MPVGTLRRMADRWDESAETARHFARHADDAKHVGHFNGKADGYETAARELREHCEIAEALAEEKPDTR